MNNYPVAGHLQIRLAAVIFFGGGDRLAEFRFQPKFGESPFFGNGGLIRRLTGLGEVMTGMRITYYFIAKFSRRIKMAHQTGKILCGILAHLMPVVNKLTIALMIPLIEPLKQFPVSQPNTSRVHAFFLQFLNLLFLYSISSAAIDG